MDGLQMSNPFSGFGAKAMEYGQYMIPSGMPSVGLPYTAVGEEDVTVVYESSTSYVQSSSSSIWSYCTETLDMSSLTSAGEYIKTYLGPYGLLIIGAVTMALCSTIGTYLFYRIMSWAYGRFFSRRMDVSPQAPMHQQQYSAKPMMMGGQKAMVASASVVTRIGRIYSCSMMFMWAWLAEVKCATRHLVSVLMRPTWAALAIMRKAPNMCEMERTLYLQAYFAAVTSALSGSSPCTKAHVAVLTRQLHMIKSENPNLSAEDRMKLDAICRDLQSRAY